MIEIEHLTKRYDDTIVVDDVSLRVVRRSGDERGAMFERLHEAPEFVRIVRAIGVDRADQFRRRRGDAGQDGVRNATIDRVPDDSAVRALGHQVGEHLPRFIRAGVVDEHELEAIPISESLLHAGQRVHEVRQRFRFVVAGDYDGNDRSHVVFEYHLG